MEQINSSVFPEKTINRQEVRLEEFLKDLTPVQKIGDLYFKREDWFAPLGYGGVNGSKLRQLIWLVNGYHLHGNGVPGVISGAVTGSPQHPMAAIVAAHYGMHYISVVGTEDFEKPNLKLAKNYGADFLTSKVGYAKTLESKAFEFAKKNNYFCVETNIVVNAKSNNVDRVKNFHGVGAIQTQNIPGLIESLIIPCGSATSTISILLGISKNPYNYVNLKEIVLMGIGNIGSKNIQFIFERLKFMGYELPSWIKITHINLNGSGYCKYEDLMPFNYHGIEFHPRYEGKCMNWLSEKEPERLNEKTMFWIVGSEPKF